MAQEHPQRQPPKLAKRHCPYPRHRYMGRTSTRRRGQQRASRDASIHSRSQEERQGEKGQHLNFSREKSPGPSQHNRPKEFNYWLIGHRHTQGEAFPGKSQENKTPRARNRDSATLQNWKRHRNTTKTFPGKSRQASCWTVIVVATGGLARWFWVHPKMATMWMKKRSSAPESAGFRNRQNYHPTELHRN